LLREYQVTICADGKPLAPMTSAPLYRHRLHRQIFSAAFQQRFVIRRTFETFFGCITPVFVERFDANGKNAQERQRAERRMFC